MCAKAYIYAEQVVLSGRNEFTDYKNCTTQQREVAVKKTAGLRRAPGRRDKTGNVNEKRRDATYFHRTPRTARTRPSAPNTEV